MEFPGLLANNMSGVWFCIILCLLSILTWYLSPKHQKNRANFHWPILGALPFIIRNSHRLPECSTEQLLSHGNFGSLFVEGPVFSKLIYLVTCHPKNIEYILKTNFHNFPKGADFKEIFDALGEGILNADDEIWRSQRTMIHTIVKSFVFRSTVSKLSRKLVESELVPFFAHVAREGCEIDLQDICKRFMFDSNMYAIFGKEEKLLTTDLPRNELAEAMNTMHEVVLLRHVLPMFCWKLLRFLNVGSEKKFHQANKKVRSTMKEYLSAKRESLKLGEQDTNDMLSMSIKWANREQMSEELLEDAIMNMVFAGKDAVASGIVWFFWIVCQTPRVEKKILEELKSVVLKKQIEDTGAGTTKREYFWVFDYEHVKDLVYLHAAICENLRLHPSLPFNSKSVVKEDVLPDGTVVKPGMQVLISFFAEGKMPWIWGDDSFEFKPERWIDVDGKVHKEGSKFFAFNAGPRSCLGKDMSFRLMKVFIASILFNFQVELVNGQEVCSKPAITLDMKNGLRVKVRKRVM